MSEINHNNPAYQSEHFKKLLQNNPAYRALWGDREEPTKTTQNNGRCVHRGDKIRFEGSTRQWELCLVQAAPQVQGLSVVCGCGSKTQGVWRIGKECGQQCPKYEEQQ